MSAIRREDLQNMDNDDLVETLDRVKEEMSARLKEYSEMDYRFGCVLEQVTGGLMSKTTYSKEVMFDAIHKHLCEERDEAFKEGEESARDQIQP